MKWRNDQDEEDFKQEKLIKEWLNREGRSDQFDCQYINRKGNARNTVGTRSLGLDQKINEDGSGTFADIVAGCDGRDLECGGDAHEADDGPKTAAIVLDEQLDLFFDAIGIGEETKAWAKKAIKSEESLRSLRSLMKDEKQFEISPINLELPRRWGSFKK